MDIAAIREMIEDGYSDAEIAAKLAQAHDDEIEAKVAADFERDAYGEDLPYISEWNDRISMGRNDAGEWIGFM